MAYKDILTNRYWNLGNHSVAIIAIEGGVGDVGAYIGANFDKMASEEETCRVVAEHGVKLSRHDAYAMLPRLSQFPHPYRD